MLFDGRDKRLGEAPYIFRDRPTEDFGQARILGLADGGEAQRDKRRAWQGRTRDRPALEAGLSAEV